MKKIIFFIIIFGLWVLFPENTLADSCSPNLGDSTHTIQYDCSFTGYDDADAIEPLTEIVSGLDSGTGTTNTSILTVASGILTINSNETLVAGSIELTGGSMAISEGASIIVGGCLWAIDADDDKYPKTLSFYARTSAPTDGARLNTITYVDTKDCDDNAPLIGGGDLITYYQDSDLDTYGNPNVSIEACVQPEGYVADNTDCYDANADAYPGQTTCYTTNRGDGSFDYDCDSLSSGCNNCPSGINLGAWVWTKGCTSYCYNAANKQVVTNKDTQAGCGVGGRYASTSKKTSCSCCPCSLGTPKNIGSTACTRSCR